MTSICVEFNCPRRTACMELPKSHANPHEHNSSCDKGCELHPITENGRSRPMHPCVSRK